MICLGIEGTAHSIGVGLIKDKNKTCRVLSNLIKTYKPEKGGIHPREAANHHATYIADLIRDSMHNAKVDFSDIDLIAFSQGPGERIKEVISGTPGLVPSNATLLDCRHQTLMPGLIEAHVHVGAVDANILEQQRKYFPSLLVIRTLKVIKEALDQGFTTIRDAGGADPGFREATVQGLIPGPRMFVCGFPLSQTGGHGDFRLPTEVYSPVAYVAGLATRVCDGVDQVRRNARDLLRQGVDHLKVMAGGGAMSPSDEIDTSQYSLEELKAVVFEAEAVGKYVMAHVYSSRSIRNSAPTKVCKWLVNDFALLVGERTPSGIQGRRQGGLLKVKVFSERHVSGRGRLACFGFHGIRNMHFLQSVVNYATGGNPNKPEDEPQDLRRRFLHCYRFGMRSSSRLHPAK